ncbi:exonuclease V a 5' deoxyribonuclease-domain-containing protein [Crassisporium funariophilum]|nr:exonuclease V a 5' deoxyribonuclease-domain-containing protein [Crassisporium funariophilum]
MRHSSCFLSTFYRRGYASFNQKKFTGSACFQFRNVATLKMSMSDMSSDGYSAFDLAEFTEEDFAQIDAVVASQSVPELDCGEASGHSSFQSDIYGVNLSKLTAEELAQLDAAISGKTNEPSCAPSIEIQLEGVPGEHEPPVRESSPNSSDAGTPKKKQSPKKQFRRRNIFSVTDLVSPAWCEVQFDYGLRGRRSRPIETRPKSFVSSAGKTISVKETVAKKNDIITKQGQAVHKKLEREIKVEEIQVDVSTEETRWALRLVNMLACMKGMLVDGFTREIPVFGIVHEEIVIGVVDEVVKMPISDNEGLSTTSPKRPLGKASSRSPAKKPRTRSPSPQNRIDAYFQSSKQGIDRTESEKSITVLEARPPLSNIYEAGILHVRDSKTRSNRSLPPHQDTLPGRLQLMLYRRLLLELLATAPPYDFSPVWEKLGLKSSAVLPKKFLLQAKLITDNTDFQTTCLDDLVQSWHKLVEEANIKGVHQNLELVYRQRPRANSKEKRSTVNLFQSEHIDSSDEDLAKAIAASLAESQNAVSEPLNVVDADLTSDLSTKSLEDAQLEWALQQSLKPVSGQDVLFDMQEKKTPPSSPKAKGKAKSTEEVNRSEIIGTKIFLHDDHQLETHLTHVLQWWRGERKPEGVPLRFSSRCNTCEYRDDCEWRAEKALELANKRRTDSLVDPA